MFLKEILNARFGVVDNIGETDDLIFLVIYQGIRRNFEGFLGLLWALFWDKQVKDKV